MIFAFTRVVLAIVLVIFSFVPSVNAAQLRIEERNKYLLQEFTGEHGGDEFGKSIANAGDVNGDGVNDILIGAPYNAEVGGLAGKAYLYLGGVTNQPPVQFLSEEPYSQFGLSVDTAGDINGDGYDDMIIGASRFGKLDEGKAYIYFGGADPDPFPDLEIFGETSSEYLGIAVSEAGDVNGDGYDDVMIGAWFRNNATWRGKASIYFGGESPDTTADITMIGAVDYEHFGESLDSVGDINGDGFDDILIGSPLYSGQFATQGKASVYFGGSTMDDQVDVVFFGTREGEHFGTSLSGAGDVNSDGFRDVIIGTIHPYPDYTSARASIFFGGMSMDTVEDVTIVGDPSNDSLGSVVSRAGDVNADGYDDVLVGAPYNQLGRDNQTQIFLGGVAMDAVADKIFSVKREDPTSEFFGGSLASMGDINRDGFDDILIGAYRAKVNDEFSVGKVSLFAGDNK